MNTYKVKTKNITKPIISNQFTNSLLNFLQRIKSFKGAFFAAFQTQLPIIMRNQLLPQLLIDQRMMGHLFLVLKKNVKILLFYAFIKNIHIIKLYILKTYSSSPQNTLLLSITETVLKQII